MRTVILLMTLTVTAMCWGQTKKSAPVAPTAPSPAGADKPKDPPLPEVPLTDSEAKEFFKDLEIQRLKEKILQLDIQQVQSQVENQFHFHDQSMKLNQERQALVSNLGNAHKLDLTKYRLDEQKKVFVPIGEAK